MNRSTDKILVGVYGTLKAGESNHALLSDSEKVCNAYLPDSALADLRYYPGLIDGKQVVKLEVYAVTSETLATLDRLEGHPSLFIREERKVIFPDFSTKTIVIYKFNRYNNQKLYKPEDKIINWEG